jgi:hypothetical protein
LKSRKNADEKIFNEDSGVVLKGPAFTTKTSSNIMTIKAQRSALGTHCFKTG